MSKWEDFGKKEEKSRPEGKEIGGVYMCQFCNKMVLGATYYPLDFVLKYKCEDEHTSFIEGFKLSI